MYSIGDTVRILIEGLNKLERYTLSYFELDGESYCALICEDGFSWGTPVKIEDDKSIDVEVMKELLGDDINLDNVEF